LHITASLLIDIFNSVFNVERGRSIPTVPCLLLRCYSMLSQAVSRPRFNADRAS